MRKRLLALVSGAFAVAATVVPGSFARAQDIKERTFKLALLPTEQHPIGLGAKRFADLVSEKSAGRMKVRLFASGQLGGDLPVVSALQGGTVEMTILVTSLLAGVVKDFTLLDAPFLFNAGTEADAVLDGPVGRKLLDKLPEKGLVGLGYFEYGFRHFLNGRRPVQKLEDLAGLKIRTSQTPLLIEFVNALGANATPLPIPELYTALEQKAVDGMDSPVSFIRPQKYDEVQKHLVLTKHIYNPQALLVSKRVLDRLSADERKVLGDAFREARDYQRRVSREQDVTELDALRKTMQVTELPQPDIARMREKAKPLVEKFNKEIDPALVTGLQAELAKLRGTN